MTVTENQKNVADASEVLEKKLGASRGALQRLPHTLRPMNVQTSVPPVCIFLHRHGLAVNTIAHVSK